jgi:FlaA1/EpsC-like NDP-sugar epimerase
MMKNYFNNKTVLITGVCGTVGSELAKQLLGSDHYNIAELIGVDNNEGELFFQDQKYITEERARFFVGDIRDREELSSKFEGVDIVFHCAALKHVILCERSPEQAVLSNIVGIQNVISAAKDNEVEKVIFTSSDKAVNPTNVMGTSKLMGERLMTAANSNKRDSGPVFASTRFGNVLGSSGSVIPIFHNQIAKGGPVTLTDKDMTRFVMSIEEAVKLVIDSAVQVHGGEVLITKMPVIRIFDLATAMIEELAPVYGHKIEDIELEIIGTKPGEKLYEELMSIEETRRSLELKDFFSILPAFRGIYHDIDYSYPGTVSDNVDTAYTSAEENALTVEEIKKMLTDYSLLESPDQQINNRYWPGDKEENQA